MPRPVKTCIRAAALIAAVAGLAGCGGVEGDAEGPATPAVVAVVGADEITAGEFDAVIAESRRSWDAEDEDYPEPGSTKYLDLRRQAVELLIERSQTEQAAAARGVVASASEVERQLGEVKRGSGAEELEAGRTDEQLRAGIREELLRFETYRSVVAEIEAKDENELSRLRTEAWRRWTKSVETQYVASRFAPGFDPDRLPRNVRRHPRPENQRPLDECDLPDGVYDYGELVERGCAGDVGYDAGPGDTFCSDLFLQELEGGFSSEEANSGYMDVLGNLAGTCARELGPHDVSVHVGLRR